MKPILIHAWLLLFPLLSSAQAQDSARVLYQKAMADMESRKYKPAFEKLQQAVSLDSTHTAAIRKLGLAAIEIRRYDVAISSFQTAIRQQTDDTISLRLLAQLHFQTRKWDNAIRDCHQMLSLQMSGRVNYILGKSYWQKEDYGNAFRYLDAAYKEEPKNIEIPVLFAKGLVDMSNFKQAVKYYQEAIEMDSSRLDLIYETALAYSSMPDDKSAVMFYELAMKKGYPVDDDFIENIANSYMSAGMPDRSIALQLQLLEKRPGDLSLLFNIAQTYYETKRYDQAIDAWQQLLTFDKENARAVYMIGLSYQHKGDKSKGKGICNKAIEMDPKLKDYRHVKQWLRL
jgi:tetratricopeptide (TPR) repeat protein